MMAKLGAMMAKLGAMVAKLGIITIKLGPITKFEPKKTEVGPNTAKFELKMGPKWTICVPIWLLGPRMTMFGP